MEEIIVGLIVGLAVGTSIYVYNSHRFSLIQKAFLLICIVFPPLQWTSILIILAYKKVVKENSAVNKNIKRETFSYNEKLKSLNELRNKGLLTQQEYEQKVRNLEKSQSDFNLKFSDDYRNLKKLYDEGILTQEEFENKINILKGENNSHQEIKLDINKLQKISDKDLNKIIEIYSQPNTAEVLKKLREKIESLTYILLHTDDKNYIKLIIEHRKKLRF